MEYSNAEPLNDFMGNPLVLEMADIESDLDNEETNPEQRELLLKRQHQIIARADDNTILALAQYRKVAGNLPEALEVIISDIKAHQKLWENER